MYRYSRCNSYVRYSRVLKYIKHSRCSRYIRYSKYTSTVGTADTASRAGAVGTTVIILYSTVDAAGIGRTSRAVVHNIGTIGRST